MLIVHELQDAAWEGWWKTNNHTDQLYDLKSEAQILVGNVLYHPWWKVFERAASSTNGKKPPVVLYILEFIQVITLLQCNTLESPLTALTPDALTSMLFARSGK